MEDTDASGSTVSPFDCSVESHFRAVDMMFKLCGESENIMFEEGKIECLLNSVTFLRDWRQLDHITKAVHFDTETQGKVNYDCIKLPQFSAAAVPKRENLCNESTSSEFRKDFVLSVGGTVWALDWCPRLNLRSDSDITSEFIAISAHPPNSPYHKLGAPLSGRGIIQIWHILNHKASQEDSPGLSDKPNKKTQRHHTAKRDETQSKRPRGRPRKSPNAMSQDIPKSESQFVPALAVEYPDKSLNALQASENIVGIASPEEIKGKMQETCKEVSAGNVKPNRPVQRRNRPKHRGRVEEDKNPLLLTDNQEKGSPIVELVQDGLKNDGRVRNIADDDSIICLSGNPAVAVGFPEKSRNVFQAGEDIVDIPGPAEIKGKKGKSRKGVSASNVKSTHPVQRKNQNHKARVEDDKDKLLLTHNEEEGPPIVDLVEDSFKKHETVRNVESDDSAVSLAGNAIPDSIFLPRVVLCLAHDGEVAWDVKWRPHNLSDSDCKYRMGYLAAILGNGSLEVWDVPTPQAMNILYSSRHEEDGDPRYVKLMPVFRCSMLRHGDRQSIPLTLEWSTSPPHDFILTGCHDGVVALFKFSTNGSCEDSRPVLCFSADTAPIRALAWAPSDGDAESRNVIVTAGHNGMKFWDLRDPFRPLWFPKPHEAYIYSLDWPPDPRCLIATYDDGTVRVFSLRKAAYDAPVTGEQFSGAKSQGEHFYTCSSFAIWSVHGSRLTGGLGEVFLSMYNCHKVCGVRMIGKISRKKTVLVNGRVAYCGANGKVCHFQITAKDVDNNDTRTRSPHFLCGALTEHGSAVIVNSPQGDMSYAAERPGIIARSCRPTVYGSIQAEWESTKTDKQTNRELTKTDKPNDQVLALCYGDYHGGDDMNLPLKSLKNPKTKMTKSDKGRDKDQVLIRREDEGANASADGKADEGADANGKTDEGAGNTNSIMKADGKPELMFPPKVVAIHKVRWNMNKGSERWLCYGGAAGIVRCQEISNQVIDKKRLRRSSNVRR